MKPITTPKQVKDFYGQVNKNFHSAAGYASSVASNIIDKMVDKVTQKDYSDAMRKRNMRMMDKNGMNDYSAPPRSK